MERQCYCDSPDGSLLRIVLIGEILRVDEADLYDLAEVFDTLGLLQLLDVDDDPTPEPTPASAPKAKRRKANGILRRVK